MLLSQVLPLHNLVATAIEEFTAFYICSLATATVIGSANNKLIVQYTLLAEPGIFHAELWQENGGWFASPTHPFTEETQHEPTT